MRANLPRALRVRHGPAGALCAVSLLTVGALAGCGGASHVAGSTTCFAYGELGLAQRSMLLADLLTDGGLDPVAQGNELGIRTAVDDFCGSTAVPLTGASRNLDAPIRDAVDWDAEDW